MRLRSPGIRKTAAVAGILIAVALVLHLYAHIMALYEVVLEQGYTIELLLQAENDRLEAALAERNAPRSSPAPVPESAQKLDLSALANKIVQYDLQEMGGVEYGY
jgi:hypothetical protein